MSKIEVLVRDDFRILPHPNAERLELAEIGGEGGYIAVVGKGQFKPGDLLIYVPEDSVIPEEMSSKLTNNSKIKIGPRIKAAKIRGVVSQGLCLKVSDWAPSARAGQDIMEDLKITKYEPPEPAFQGFNGGKRSGYENANFHKYTSIENLKKYPRIFQEGDPVIATVKYHGTNFRAGLVRKQKMGFVDRILAFFSPKKKFEYLVGSHNVIRKIEDDGIYWKIARQYDLEKWAEKLSNGRTREIVFYGEIIGPGIQKGYTYGIPEGENQLVLFDIQIDGRYVDFDYVKDVAHGLGIRAAEEVYRGPWNKEVLKLAEETDYFGDTPVPHVREGLVVRSMKEEIQDHFGRKILKVINPEYLLKGDNSDFH